MTRARVTRLAALASVLAVLPAAPAVAQASQSSWLGTTTFAAQAKLASLGDPPAAIAYSPDGRDVVLARTSGTSGERLRVVVARHDAATGRLTARGACLSFPASSGCTTIPDAPKGVFEVQVSADGRAVHLVGNGVLTLARDTASGALTPIAGACLPAAGVARCQDGTTSLSLALPRTAGAPGYLADGTTLRLVTRDPATGVPAYATGPQSCLADAGAGTGTGTGPGAGAGAGTSVPAGCTVAPGAGARGIRTTSDGRHVYGTSVTGRDIVIVRAGVDAAQALTPGPAVTVRNACTTDEECGSSEAFISPDDRHLYLSTPVDSFDATFSDAPPSYAIGADGTLAPVACPKRGCGPLVRPVTFSPEGDQVYGLVFGSTSGETIGATVQQVTYARDATTGILRAKDAYGTTQLGDVIESTGAKPADLAASPDGRWLLTSDLEVLARRTVRPPTISVKGLPAKGRCARRDVLLRITVSGANRDPKRVTSADATFSTSESGLSRGNRRTRAKRFTLRVRRSPKGQMLVTITTPGKRYNDVTREVEFRFC